MKSFRVRILILGAAILLGAAPGVARAENLPGVKARMSARLSRLDVLKASGAIGAMTCTGVLVPVIVVVTVSVAVMVWGPALLSVTLKTWTPLSAATKV